MFLFQPFLFEHGVVWSIHFFCRFLFYFENHSQHFVYINKTEMSVWVWVTRKWTHGCIYNGKNRKEKWLSIQTELLFYCVNIIRCERWKTFFFVCLQICVFYRKRNIVWHVAFEVRKLENWHWETLLSICFGLVCLPFYLFFVSSFVAPE